MSNETKVIVVIGSVTYKQYQPERIKFLRMGQKPRIIRVADEFFPADPEYGNGMLDRDGVCTLAEAPPTRLFEVLADMFFADYGIRADCADLVVVEEDYRCIDLDDDGLRLIFGSNIDIKRV